MTALTTMLTIFGKISITGKLYANKLWLKW